MEYILKTKRIKKKTKHWREVRQMSQRKQKFILLDDMGIDRQKIGDD